MEFKPGELVRLKSGGPDMTVEQVGHDAYDRFRVWVAWFNEQKQLQTATFAPEALERSEAIATSQT